MTQADLEWAIEQGLLATNRTMPEIQSDDHERPTIYVSNRHMRDISEDALEALKLANMKRPVLFCRGTSLVRIQTSDAGTSAEALVQASLRGILDRVANFIKATDKGDFPARPPSDVIADILTLPDPGFPWLLGFSEAPVFLPSGCLLNQPGYDVESGLFLTLNGLESVHSDIPVQEAVSLLQDDLLPDFPFSDQGSKAHAIALLSYPYTTLGNHVASSGTRESITSMNSCIRTKGTTPLYISMVDTSFGATPRK